MAKKPIVKSAKNRALIDTKFALTPTQLAAKLARQKAPKPKVAKGVGAPAQALLGRKFYGDFPLGKFEGEPHLVWTAPDIFRHDPQKASAFRFVRKTGEVVAPGTMYTDGGSIPRPLWFVKDLSPWAYAPAFLIHDWLFDCHHCGKTDKSFEEVRDIMMEGVRTLMESGVCERNRLTFELIYTGIDSFVARQVWDKPGCALP
jgi:hypothetical protein